MHLRERLPGELIELKLRIRREKDADRLGEVGQLTSEGDNVSTVGVIQTAALGFQIALDRSQETILAGEAVVTVLAESGAPTPVAWTRLRAPRSLMAQLDPAAQAQAVAGSPLSARYGQPLDRESDPTSAVRSRALLPGRRLLRDRHLRAARALPEA